MRVPWDLMRERINRLILCHRIASYMVAVASVVGYVHQLFAHGEHVVPMGVA
jgi:hypothetical protein